MKCVGLQACRGREETENRRSRRFIEQNDPLPLLRNRDPNHVSTAVQPRRLFTAPTAVFPLRTMLF